MSRPGHPLPGSDEARHREIPEHLEAEKGRGDDSRPVVQPDKAVNPDGEPYRYDDLGRGPGTETGKNEEDEMADERRDSSEQELQSSTGSGGAQAGGGPGRSDMGAPGGSSGTGGYGQAQNQQLHQGQARDRPAEDGRSRGESFDEAQGGGRGPESVSDVDEFASDQADHQDRGQSVAETESDDR